MKKREVRNFKSEVRSQVVDGKEKIVGYAAVFNQLSEPLKIGNRSFRERVMPQAFDRCLGSNPDIRGLVNHDVTLVLGRTKSGTMTVSKDEHGLRYVIDPPNTSYANDLRESMRRGDIDASSFGFYTTEDNWIIDEESGETIRELLAIDCFDVSPVTYPAYDGSSSGVEARSLFPDGVPKKVRSHLSEARGTDDESSGGSSGDDEQCECDCPQCQDDDCEACSNSDCEDPNCRCMERSRKGGETRDDAKTKKVDGKDLNASDFAHVGDKNDPSTWKLPIHDADHVRNALARFNQVKGLSADEKKAAWSKITAAAKKFGIQISEENSLKLFNTASYRDAKALLRMMDPDGDGDDDEPLIMALIDARDACSTVSGTASGALWTFFDGDSDYSSPMLEAFVKQASALIADLQGAIAEVNKELSEDNAAEASSSGQASSETRSAQPLTSLQRIDRMAYLERD